MNRITLHHIDGYVWSYESLEDAYNQLGYDFISNNVGEQFDNIRTVTVFVNCRSIIEYRKFHADFILRDEAGKEITYRDFYSFVEKDYRIRNNLFKKKEVVRGNGPVAGIRKISGKYKGYRHPHTTAEKKSVLKCFIEALDSNVFVRVRPKRNIVNLVDAYDDVHRSDIDDRSWKANKRNKHQWK